MHAKDKDPINVMSIPAIVEYKQCALGWFYLMETLHPEAYESACYNLRAMQKYAAACKR